MQQAFDTIANDYDASFTNSFIGKAQRNIVWNYLERSISSGEKLNVLELNCGTGEDAVWFGKRGHHVLATDISENMLAIAQKKISDAGLDSLIKTMKLDISKIDYTVFNEKFDLIFSNFGGLNCISFKEMEKLSTEITKLLNPNGQIIMVIMPTFCFWETFYFLLKLNFKKAFRRFSEKAIAVKLNGSDVNIYYHSPLKVKKIFAQNFKLISVKPVGFFIPPSYLDNFFSSRNKIFNALKKLEQAIYGFSFFSGSSDHYLIQFQVKS